MSKSRFDIDEDEIQHPYLGKLTVLRNSKDIFVVVAVDGNEDQTYVSCVAQSGMLQKAEYGAPASYQYRFIAAHVTSFVGFSRSSHFEGFSTQDLKAGQMRLREDDFIDAEEAKDYKEEAYERETLAYKQAYENDTLDLPCWRLPVDVPVLTKAKIRKKARSTIFTKE